MPATWRRRGSFYQADDERRGPPSADNGTLAMNKFAFLNLMGYPSEWLEWNMYPDELFEKQLHMYRQGDERGAEHDRNGAFHWWLKQDITADQLKKLILLTFKDPDPIMAGDVRKHIDSRNGLPQDVRTLLRAETKDARGGGSTGL
jgi:hypothetical protein